MFCEGTPLVTEHPLSPTHQCSSVFIGLYMTVSTHEMSQTVDHTSPVTFHTSVDKPFLLYRPCKAGKLSWPGWLVTHHEGHPMHQ